MKDEYIYFLSDIEEKNIARQSHDPQPSYIAPGLPGHPFNPIQLWHGWLLADEIYFSQYWS